MSLLQIKEYLKSKRLVSLFDLSKQFSVEPDILREMLKLFISKGYLRSQTKTPKCGTRCLKCPASQFELYQWVEPSK